MIGDTHFGHTNILKFKRMDGTPLRDFSDMEEMHETMVQRWNHVVREQDKVYHLGDVAFSKPGLAIMGRLNGKKRLVRGNHDLFKIKEYLKYFQEIYGVRQIDGFWLTHVPMHEGSLSRAKANIHGHLHEKHIRDPRYINVSVERINYTPIAFDEIRKDFENDT